MSKPIECYILHHKRRDVWSLFTVHTDEQLATSTSREAIVKYATESGCLIRWDEVAEPGSPPPDPHGDEEVLHA